MGKWNEYFYQIKIDTYQMIAIKMSRIAKSKVIKFEVTTKLVSLLCHFELFEVENTYIQFEYRFIQQF